MTIGDYDVLRVIGDGSFADVFKARHHRHGYICAIKQLKQTIENEQSPAYLKFMDECRTLFRLGAGGHPNILRMSNPQLINCKAVVEMDYIDGISMFEYLKREQFIPMDEVMRFTHELVSAMAFCHRDIYRFMMDPREDSLLHDPNDGSRFMITPDKERELIAKYQVIHNDLHSNNVMRRHYDGRYVLLDFGLAIQNNDCVKSSSRRDGSPEYKSPEKAAGLQITAASDVYSMGILMYEMVAGRVPFVLEKQQVGESELAPLVRIEEAHKTKAVPDARELRRQAFERKFPDAEYTDDVPQRLLDIIYKCLEKDPAHRYSDAREVYDDIAALGRPAQPAELSSGDEIVVVAAEPAMLDPQLRSENQRLSRDLTAAQQQLANMQRTLTDAQAKLSESASHDREALELYRNVERLKTRVNDLQSANGTLNRDKEAALQSLWAKDAELQESDRKLKAAEATGGKLVLALIAAVFVIGFMIYQLLK